MLLVQFTKVSKDYAGNPIFDELDLEVIEGDRIGLVGENGGGKSTMFKLIAGIEQPTEGSVTRRRNLTLGYLTQEPDPAQNDKTVFEAVAEISPEATALAARLHDLESSMSTPRFADDSDYMEHVLTTYTEAQERFDALGGYALEHQVEDVLNGLGFGADRYSQTVGSLSGGEKKLVSLARILLKKPDLLLLDEPDNHLDLEAKAWLEGFIRSYPGTVMIISHDRYLLEHVVKKIYELEDGQIGVYVGNYTHFVEERRQRLLKRQELYTLQRDEIKRLEVILRNLTSWAKQNPKFDPRARSMEKRVERARREAAERPILQRDHIKVAFDSERSGVKVLELKAISKTIDGRPLFRPFDLTVLYRERVALVGPNGSGKTTLLRIIAGLIPPDGGIVKMGPSVLPGYYTQEHESLPAAMTPMDFVRSLKPLTEQAAISTLRTLLFSYRDMHNTIGSLSGGEKSRLQIARLMLTDANFLILDEPTNNLDIASIEVLEAALLEFEGTILTVSHDRYFLDKIVTRTVALSPDGNARFYAGNYSYYLEKSALPGYIAESV
jgi:ATP-binding cassette subfamily F protein 3